MENNELLQAIRQIVKEEVEPIKQDVSNLKEGQEFLKQDVSNLKEGQEFLKQDVSNLKEGQEFLKQDVSNLKEGQKSLKQEVTKTNITLENDIDRKLSALFDAHQLDKEKIDHISETVDEMNNAYAATDIVTRVNAAEINKLKSKIG